MRVLVLGLFLCGCPVAHQSAAARAQEAASELNVNTRFGRMEMASEWVAPSAKEQFFQRRSGWGSKIRIADYELAGMRMIGKDEEDMEMFVKVAWNRVDEGDLHVTTLKQKWHDFKGAWKLTEEARIDGDLGLLGEPPAPPPPGGAPPSATAKRTQFPTIHLGAPSAPPNEELPTDSK